MARSGARVAPAGGKGDNGATVPDAATPSYPHRRFDPLTREWVLVSPHRMQRPWQGLIEPGSYERLPEYDPDCYLCPGNTRAGGARNPDYRGTFVFTNDFAALHPDAPDPPGDPAGLLRSSGVRGECRVLCFSPRHDLTLSRMTQEEREVVVDLWADQTAELGQEWRWVQLFENRGELMGASNPHPHGQVWALDALPTIAAREDEAQRDWHERHGRPLLLAYAELEAERRERLVLENDEWLAVVPYWAVWPFETLVLPRRHTRRLPDLDAPQRAALAELLGRLLARYDNLFETSFPYSLGWHGAPFAPGGGPQASEDHWQLHAHIYPPLLRSATVRKFMVGFELLAEAQRDLTPERAAERLAALPDRHYLERA